ncbi:hypothetical protein [Bacillus thuringiensis]|uniref:hypothetical protein n=1 Tax=Bacillus thuringiensis TaxID=1428 RepID=UPI000BFB6960|nr:hypothetical protein [Bacillus thuringiensis]PGT89930.1 hypothetical protein COD17_09275 [Bacillus thuringiensis]
MANLYVTDVQDLQTVLVEELVERLPNGSKFGLYDVDVNGEVTGNTIDVTLVVGVVVEGQGVIVQKITETFAMNDSFLEGKTDKGEIADEYLNYLERLVDWLNKEEKVETIGGYTFISGKTVNKLYEEIKLPLVS